MAAVDILPSRKPWIGPIKFDASISEEHSTEVELTDRPIEAGATVTDHAITLPRSITMVVGVSNTPDELLSVPSPTRHLRVWRQLDDLAQRHELVDVVTSLRIYPLMMLVSLRTTRTRDTSNALQIVARLRRVEFASIDPTQAIADAAHEIALGTQDIGAQQAAIAAAVELAALGTLVAAGRVSSAVPGLIPG